MIRRAALAFLLASVMGGIPFREAARAQPLPSLTQEGLEALTLAKESISLRSVAGPGNRTPDVAGLYRRALIAGGFPPGAIAIARVGDTAYLVFRWAGQTHGLKPLVISGHMDVVAANPADWTRDPFTPIVEEGYLYGRGATDMKLSNALVITALVNLHRHGYRPRRDIVLALSGDEETAMVTSRILAEKLHDAGMVLNIDVGGGTLDEKTGQPLYFVWSGAEKTYADYRLVVTDPGGHSSEPRARNAIDVLARALIRVETHEFTPELNALTRSYFVNAARLSPAPLAAAMRAFAASPGDRKAIATLRAEPSLTGMIGTTCVVTTVRGGHALNALPQRAEANINCRIFPGHSRRDILHELSAAIGDGSVKITDETANSVETDASPLDPVFSSAISEAADAAFPDVPVFPGMSAGASDSMWFRQRGVPSYGASPIFIKASDNFSHGLNERSPLSTITPGMHYFESLIPALSR
ncbi:M20/M25/M40 family metallo-hydrolase [Swaminathania salitolerans]|uniref:Peptidase M20 n=1 Tax=Swaminathania salitolerans TaxID=182838 RepID=A0A511BPT6_9PROT|nr:M20/M25/M40 family metallo-hydrolase [Swaminathania salitolerans]GBQ13532.1 hypothetical protein AA21291_1537 [Swaminathania salitolerans LMG 21291]GEL02337.1 peptidase M20 [Swaminathania salitolerans]